MTCMSSQIVGRRTRTLFGLLLLSRALMLTMKSPDARENLQPQSRQKKKNIYIYNVCLCVYIDIYTHTAGKIGVEHISICLGGYVSKGAIDMKLSPHVSNNPYIQRNQNK